MNRQGKLATQPLLLIINFAIIASVIWALFSLSKTTTMNVSALAVNVRTGPSIEYEVTAQAKKGDKLTILKEENQWYQVRLKNHQVGWVASWLVSQNISSSVTNVHGTIKIDNTELQNEPGQEGRKIATLRSGLAVVISEEQDNWSKISIDKKEGWVPSDSLSLVSDAPTDTDQPAVQPPAEIKSLYARDNNTKLRSEASLDGSIVATLKYGQELSYKSQEGDWYQVTTADGQSGYVANWVVSFTSLDESKKQKATSIAETTILLDPGHGGEDVGAQSNDGYISEKVVTLATANYVAAELRKLGANVVLTRDDDSFVYLADIVKKSNAIKADAFISFHYDSTEVHNQATGFTTYYYADMDRLLAQTLNDSLAAHLPLTNRGVEVGDYLVIRDNERPAILLELGYMNNDVDVQVFKTKKFQRQVAKSVADGLANYFGND